MVGLAEPRVPLREEMVVNRKTMTKLATTWVLLLACMACGDDRLLSDPGAGGSGVGGGGVGAGPSLRVAQYNIYFLGTDLLQTDADQALAAAAVINRHDIDVQAINEFEYDLPNGSEPPGSMDGGQNAQLFASKLVAGNTGAPYVHTLQIMTNQGHDWEGFDVASHDPYFERRGLGSSPGPINYAVVSRYPILKEQVRVITEFAWTDLPDSLIPQIASDTGIQVPAGYPLFSKAVAIVPIQVDAEVVFLVMMHTIPPISHVLNPYRNHDELVAVRMLIEGTLPGVAALPEGARFVLLGDFNSDPDDGDSLEGSIQPLLSHPLLQPLQPEGAGTVGSHPERNTFEGACPASPPAPVPGLASQFQLDYLLPSTTFAPALAGGVFFPDHQTEAADWELACSGSDHMLVWAELPL